MIDPTPGPPLGDIHRMGRVAAGDAGAFRELFDIHAPAVLGMLGRMLRDRGLAEEVLQETFLQAWQQAGRYRPELASPRGWLLLIARSRALDRLRARASQARREEGMARDEPGPRTVEPVGTADMEREESRSRVAAALAELPAEQRRAIELAFFEGLSHSRIAATLGAPLGTVKSRILLGMNKLRQRLTANAEERT
jgi:RNA polymerase sigma-70 factor (ECF subfamily)